MSFRFSFYYSHKKVEKMEYNWFFLIYKLSEKVMLSRDNVY